MSIANRSGIWEFVAWVIFPIIPTALGISYYQALNFGIGGGPDPREWEWPSWVMLTGPLVGYGFLAGATLGQPDDPEPRWFRRLLAKRSIWVAVGPWFGFLSAATVGYGVAIALTPFAPNAANGGIGSMIPVFMSQILWIAGLGWLAYGWFVVAFMALRRAKRRGRFLRSLGSGLVGAIALVGSLFGTFWAVTSLWREYFFDKRIMPLVLATASLALASGCAAPITRGEVRRRDLFQSLLMASLVGTALAWRWWSRLRSKDIR